MPPTHRRRPSSKSRNTRRKTTLSAKEYIAKLRHLYPSCQFDKDRKECENEYIGHKITYGEMEYEGMQKLYEYANNAGHEVVGVRGFAGEISAAQRRESRKSNTI